MPSPFPGMDPYLEDADLWSGFHHAFLSALQDRIAPVVRPKYFVRVEERVYVTQEDDPGYRYIVPDLRVVAPDRRRTAGAGLAVADRPIAEPIPVTEPLDREVHEHRLEILDRVDRTVVTVIELLSPTNKVPGSFGRQSFLQKRREVYGTTAHWMEIDLLRGGTRTANVAETRDAEYQVFVSRAGNPRMAHVWPIHLRGPLPVVGVPLRGGDGDVPVDLQDAFNHVYEVSGYDVDIDYAAETDPPLAAPSLEWARGLISSWSQTANGATESADSL